ncbi:DDHD-domain-containing protein [Teratosphaeria nubilosa]|uniref:DDHD-domain-containing protein n=1 Tax=Teratosphaeria nubilosa TaxID=161662 RepID=A0A6G1LIV9_9PEZI|nr:DDHD-domain-containing protein [Teratosphaeria nubilosa]
MAADSAGQSYLSKLSPWSRTPTVASNEAKEGEPKSPPLQRQKGGDHVVTHRHRLSLKKYPRDCPPVRPCWFHAVDVPKRRPHPTGGEAKEEKPAATPKKYAAFSVTDSKAIEAAFQKLLEEEDNLGGNQAEQRLGDLSLREHPRSDDQPNTSLKDDQKPCKVPVNEDYLFDVDVEKRELAPAYWLGPVYDVRRGTWFYQDGTTQRPCDENLAAQLEEGYLKLKPWRFPQPQPSSAKQRSASQPPRESKPRPTSWAPDTAVERTKPPAATQLTPQTSSGDLRAQASKPQAQQTTVETGQDEHPQNTYRLFGSHMNSVVTYQDGKTAWLLTDDFMSRMNYSVYQRFAGGGHFAGIKLTRGWVNPALKPPAEKDGKAADAKDNKATVGSKESAEHLDQAAEEQQANRPSLSETRRQNLQRQMSSLLEDPSTKEDPDKQDEEVRRRDEREIEEDYREAEGEEQGREIEHLILVTHGIGQRLGLRLESVNFVHDLNTLRKTMKAVYADSPDLRALNAELAESESVNSRVQVLPICWRHLLDFPKQSLKHNRKEHDLADTEIEDDDFPSLDDITVEGVPAVRNLITDLALDILLYQSPAYKDHISRIVVSECNRIYHLFMERNPEFNGKISFLGHSLGSAIMFDILCTQGQQLHSPQRGHHKETQALKLDFEVEDFYALGSPIGLFQMLKGRNIVAREKPEPRKRSASASIDDDPMLGAPSLASRKTIPSLDTTSGLDMAHSSPKCAQIFNIFHPTDPISYRLEPLISPTMASLKPQPLPYTKRGIFGAPMGQGLTGIGARVSQSVSSMWSSMASSLLTRGLGYTGTEPTQMPGIPPAASKSSVPLSLSQGAGTNISAGVIPQAPLPAQGTEFAKLHEAPSSSSSSQEQIATQAMAAGQSGQHPPTLIDAELETLYGRFQKRRSSVQTDDAGTRDLGGRLDSGEAEAEARARKLKREEAKVRRLNANGRVDYAIQEGVFDINLIAAIASHLSYWSDEDVCHFLLSQLLSRGRVVVRREGGGG